MNDFVFLHITKKTRDRLYGQKIHKGETYDKILKRLIRELCDRKIKIPSESIEYTTIRIREPTRKLLLTLKTHKGETFDQVITRLIDLVGEE